MSLRIYSIILIKKVKINIHKLLVFIRAVPWRVKI